MWVQREIRLRERRRGFHLITDEIIDALPELKTIGVGILHLFIRHTSASLGLNENADPDVRTDLESSMNNIVPERQPFYTHNCEGDDDMPAHIKSMLIGASQTIPIRGGRLALGTWQGIYLCEHRNHGGSRSIILTLHGE